MKKSQSSPSLSGGQTTSTSLKRTSGFRRNAFSWNHLADALPSAYQVEEIEKIDSVIPSSVSQKLICYETYGFPTDILHSTTITKEEQEDKIISLSTCLVTPEDPPTKTQKFKIKNLQEKSEEEEVSTIEERFNRLLLSVRKRRKQLSLSL
jgi:hypothetical protein